MSDGIELVRLASERDAVERLKRDWLHDPCYDLADVEGFEAYRPELEAFEREEREKMRQAAEAQLAAAKRAGLDRIEQLGVLLGVMHAWDSDDEKSRKRIALAAVDRLDRIATALEGISDALALGGPR